MTDMLKFYICDDDKLYANTIKNKISVYMNNTSNDDKTYTISVFNDGDSLLKEFNRQFADVVLLDIDMPGMNGFEVASLIQKRKEDILIMFVTNHEDRVFQSYDYHPFWFIRKNHLDDLNVILPKLMKKIEVEKEKKHLTYNLETDSRIIEVNINTLIYIESYKNDIIIKDKVADDVQVRCKISSAEKQLYPFNIIRIQNGILVNCRFISKITSREVVLTNGSHFGLSRSRIGYVKEEYQNYVRSKVI